MWTALAIIVVILSIVWYAMVRAEKQGETKQVNDQISATIDAIKRGNDARDSLSSLRDDPNNRDTLRDSETD